MASAELHRAPLQVVCIGDALDVAVDPGENRRIHERLKASDLRWLRGARIKYGADIRVLDISAGGMLLETRASSHLTRTSSWSCSDPRVPILVPSRVLRCRTASLGEILKYQGACAFKRPLTIPELTRAACCAQAPVARPVAAAPNIGWQKVIARFIDGRIVAGYTNDFHPSKQQLHLLPNPRQGESTFIPLAQLKALFFVREFSGNPTLVESKDFSTRRRDARSK